MNSYQAVPSPAVTNVEQKAKQVLASVYELQPRINVLGMEPEAESLKDMKDNLVELVKALTLDKHRLARVVGSCREDALSSLLELKRTLNSVESREMNDDALHRASIIAELFSRRCQEYLASKEQFKTI